MKTVRDIESAARAYAEYVDKEAASAGQSGIVLNRTLGHTHILISAVIGQAQKRVCIYAHRWPLEVVGMDQIATALKTFLDRDSDARILVATAENVSPGFWEQAGVDCSRVEVKVIAPHVHRRAGFEFVVADEGSYYYREAGEVLKAHGQFRSREVNGCRMAFDLLWQT